MKNAYGREIPTGPETGSAPNRSSQRVQALENQIQRFLLIEGGLEKRVSCLEKRMDIAFDSIDSLKTELTRQVGQLDDKIDGFHPIRPPKSKAPPMDAGKKRRKRA